MERQETSLNPQFTERQLRSLIQETREIVRIRGQSYRALEGIPRELDSIESLVEGGQHGELGKKLIDVGVILVAIPEPIVSNIAGATLIAAGLAIKRFHGGTMSLADTCTELQRNIRDLNQIRKDLCSARI